jgi:hypothetical protein
LYVRQGIELLGRQGGDGRLLQQMRFLLELPQGIEERTCHGASIVRREMLIDAIAQNAHKAQGKNFSLRRSIARGRERHIQRWRGVRPPAEPPTANLAYFRTGIRTGAPAWRWLCRSW